MDDNTQPVDIHELFAPTDLDVTAEIDLAGATAQVPILPTMPTRATPAYLVEVRRPRAAPTLFAIRPTLDDAMLAAEGVHPGLAEVVIHEIPLPCDAETLARRMGGLRSWTRDGESWRAD